MNSLRSRKNLTLLRVTKYFYFVGILITPSFVLAADITGFTSRVNLSKDGTATVQEEIIYNFGEERAHGIFREIPLYFKRGDGKDVNIALTGLVVSDGKGNIEPFTVEGGGNYVRIKIGDPNVYVTGEKFYVIRYMLLGAITRDVNSNVVFYWDATSHDFPVAIDRIRTEVAFPIEVPNDELKYTCFHVNGIGVRECIESVQAGTATNTTAVLRFEQIELTPRDSFVVAASLPEKYFTLPKERKTKIARVWWQDPKYNATSLIWSLLLIALYIFLRSRVVTRRVRVSELLVVAVAFALVSASLSSNLGIPIVALSGAMIIDATLTYLQRRHRSIDVT